MGFSRGISTIPGAKARDRLKRKYGKTIAEVIALGEEVERKLAEVEDRDWILKALHAALDEAATAYRAAASALSAARKAAARKLAKLAEAQINSLAMKARFEIAVQSAEEQTALKGHGFSRAASGENGDWALAPEGGSSENSQSRWTSSGWDQVEYRIATNPGEPLKALDEIASGGEMSRVMLALKVTVEEGAMKPKAKPPTPRTLVFDEIDIGIGGRAAEAVGQKLKSLGRGQQVLCVTHLPQIAAFADQHFVVEKHESQGRTRMQIRLLDDSARTREVARMLSGAKATATSLQHAARMSAPSR